MNHIAIFHCPIQIIKRSIGKSAVAAAAYRSGERLTNEWDGMTHDYTHKGGIVHTEIMLPAHAPPEFQDRSTLWQKMYADAAAGDPEAQARYERHLAARRENYHRKKQAEAEAVQAKSPEKFV